MSVFEDARAVRKRFSAAASRYDEHAAVQREVAARLLERLDGLRFDPRRILDLGCGTGHQARALHERFDRARIVAMDFSLPMLRAARRVRGRWRRRFERVAGDIRALPVGDACFDLIHASLALQWCPELHPALSGLRRVIRPGGLLLIALPGPDLLTELRRAGVQIEAGGVIDAQRLGDSLVRAGFQEPVVDTDWLTATHARPEDLLADLEHTGIGYSLPGGHDALTESLARHRLRDGSYRSTWEIIYASAWAPDEGQPIRTEHGDEASVSVSSLGIRRRG